MSKIDRFSVGRNSEGHLITVKPMAELDTSLDLMFDYAEAAIREHPEIDYIVLEVTSKDVNDVMKAIKDPWAPDGGNHPVKAEPWPEPTIAEPATTEVPIATPVPQRRAVKDSPQA